MNRPLRLDIEQALYHITARGDRRGAIYHSDTDRQVWLAMLGETCKRFEFHIHAYCQMGNHYHLLLETLHGMLARGLRHLNGNYAAYYNRQYHQVGHVFQGRYKAILCQSNTYLLELSRYVELNPVRASLVAHPADWIWSSYRAKVAQTSAPAWLDTQVVLGHFGPSDTVAAYASFVADGLLERSPWANLAHGMLLGDADFQAQYLEHPLSGDQREIQRAQRKLVTPELSDFFKRYPNRYEAMARAYLSHSYTMPEIARHARVSVKTVSRAIAAFKTAEKPAERY
ncbi:transposase [Pseudoduganella danionis]|uniref:Addiction module toxin RelE n=1 Tax=Pseudoduganella danionis TaxID=1890295 RepID=A0ABW9SRE9_9BURK|nr:transposase [Pseudoduganella danionis]MTW34743.1 addiction module toxin RelE [Pseudoduganella danionis]